VLIIGTHHHGIEKIKVGY